MLCLNHNSSDTRTRLDTASESREQADLYRHAQKIMEAVRLIELGARAGLVRQLTGLEKAKVNRLYCQLMGPIIVKIVVVFSYAASSLITSLDISSLSGLSHTSFTGDQSLVSPLQRSGCRSFAAA